MDAKEGSNSLDEPPQESDPSILIALDYLLERDALGRAIAHLRPDLNIRQVNPHHLERAAADAHPAMIIASEIAESVRAKTSSWLMLHQNGSLYSRVCLDGIEHTNINPGLAEILAIVDDAVRIVKIDHAKLT